MSASCIPPEPDTDVIVDWDPEETVMGEIQERGELLVAIPSDQPPFDLLTADLARIVGDALGVETRFVRLPRSEMVTAPEDQQVDISFPLVTITEKLVRKHIFTDPFYIAHQRLMVPKDSSIQDVSDIEGLVCQFVDLRTGVGLAALEPDAHPILMDPEECASELGSAELQAISASDWLLFPLLVEHDDVKIVGDDLTTEGYGAVIEPGASAWQDFVNGVFAEADAEGDWQAFYDESFGPYVDEPVTYPDMTVEEAAALFPRDV